MELPNARGMQSRNNCKELIKMGLLEDLDAFYEKIWKDEYELKVKDQKTWRDLSMKASQEMQNDENTLKYVEKLQMFVNDINETFQRKRLKR
jgi:hypothetical protein